MPALEIVQVSKKFKVNNVIQIFYNNAISEIISSASKKSGQSRRRPLPISKIYRVGTSKKL